MASAKFRANMNIDEAAQNVKKDVYDLGLSIELIDDIVYNFDNCKVYLYVFEKYYFRSSNQTTLTLMITGDEFNTTIDAISSGGGEGFLFKFSWGAEKNFVNGFRKIIVDKGFEEINKK